MSKEFKNTITSQYKPNRILPTLKYLVGKIFYFWNVYITNGNIKKTQKENIFYANPIKHFLFYAKVEWKKQFLMRPNKYFEAPATPYGQPERNLQRNQKRNLQRSSNQTQHYKTKKRVQNLNRLTTCSSDTAVHSAH